jgi:hypothetical protein
MLQGGAVMSDIAGPDGSVIAHKYATGEWAHTRGQRIPERYPTNLEVAKGVEQKVSVRTLRHHQTGTMAPFIDESAVCGHQCSLHESKDAQWKRTYLIRHLYLQHTCTNQLTQVWLLLHVDCTLQASVETFRRYRHVAWYTLFVAMYMLALYYQV